MIANLCLLLVVGGFVWGWVGYGSCVFSVADGMTRELNPLTEQELGKLIERATANVEQIPKEWGARAELAQPVCRKVHPWSDSAFPWSLSILGILGFFFARNQVRLGTVRVDEELKRSRSVSRAGGRTPMHTPTSLDVGDVNLGLSEKDKRILEAVGEMSHRDESLMLYLQHQTSDPSNEQPAAPAQIDGFFCPPGFADKPVLYVDPSSSDASDDPAGEDSINNPDRPFQTVQGALKFARELVTTEGHKGAMVRLMPGVYHANLDVPDKCVVVNHRLPAEGSFRARLKWLTDQSVDHPDAVTLLAPPNAQYAVKFEPGANQGIFGCHIVGRENVKQAGLIAVNCRSMAVANCAFEGFIGGAIRVQDSGTELAGGGILIHGCRLHKNESKIGGALYAQRSSVTLVDCIIEHNKAVTGGAIYGVDLRAPLVVQRSRVAHNRAQLDESPEVSTDIPLEAWQKEEGLGGGVYLRNSRFKASGSEFVENGASVAGAGVALLACKAILDEHEESRPRFARNKSRVGAGMVVIGWPGGESTLKATNIVMERNRATISGGGIAAMGISTVQFIRGKFEENQVTEEAGTGGGAACHLGAELQAGEVEFLDNQSAGSGGAIAAVDARLTLKESTRLRANMAKSSGGGIYAITTGSQVAAELVRSRVVKLPFTVTLENIKISNNASNDLGGGLRAGNEIGRPTLPLGIKIGEDVVFQLNRTKSQVEHGDDVWVVWAGEVKATDRDRPQKLVLR